MSAAIEPFQTAPMKISLALNVALALGITALLLPTSDGPSTGSRLSRGAPAAGEAANLVNIPLSTPSFVEQRGRYKREAALPATDGELAPGIIYKSSVARVRTRAD